MTYEEALKRIEELEKENKSLKQMQQSILKTVFPFSDNV